MSHLIPDSVVRPDTSGIDHIGQFDQEQAPERLGTAGVAHVPPETGEIAGPEEARVQARQDAPEMDRDLAGAAAPNREGFLSRVGQFFHNLKEVLFGQGFTLPPTVTVTMPDGGTIDYPSERLTDMIKTLPKAQRAGFANDIGQFLSDRINNGHDLLNSVCNGVAQRGPDTPAIADILLFLEAKAVQSGHGFTEGAFSVEDPTGLLYQWLDSCPERYQRSSSHLGHQTRMQVDGHLNTHRGIDIAPGHEGLTSGKNTLLFGAIPADARLATGRRIFLKMESHGCRLNTLSRSDRVRGAADNANPDRPVRASDFGSMLGHGISFLNTRGKGSAPGSRKERIPDRIAAAYENILSKTDPRSLLGMALRMGDPLDKGAGIRVMMDNIQRNHADLQGELAEAVATFLHEVNAMEDTSHLDVRIGNEVIFDIQELR